MVFFSLLMRFMAGTLKRGMTEAGLVAEESDLDGEVVDRRGCRSGRPKVGDEVDERDRKEGLGRRRGD